MFREKIMRVWEEKGLEEWEAVKEIRGVLEAGQGKEGEEKTKRWWDADCRDRKGDAVTLLGWCWKEEEIGEW